MLSGFSQILSTDKKTTLLVVAGSIGVGMMYYKYAQSCNKMKQNNLTSLQPPQNFQKFNDVDSPQVRRHTPIPPFMK